MRMATLIGAFLVAVVGCDSTTEPRLGEMSLRFRYDGGIATSSGAQSVTASTSLVIDGSDGARLEITDLRLVVDELKLERAENACEGLAEIPPELEDQCVRFEATPVFLPVPLDGDDVGTVQALVPEGTYVALKLETKAPASGSPLLEAIQGDFAEWPAQASAVVVGVYTPADGGEARPFTVYFDAEVKAVLTLPEPFVVEAGTQEEILVFVDPAIWFVDGNGAVLDLSLFDFSAENPVVPKLEAKFEDMVTKIEVEQ